MTVTTRPNPKILNRFNAGLLLAGVLECLVPLIAISFAAASAHTWAVFGVGLLVGGAAAALGALVGFLFGVPRVLQNDQSRAVNRPNDPAAAANAHQGLANKVYTNTNLEQVSDWLTKIIVGVTLVQIGSIPGALGRLGAALRGGFGGADFSAAFAIGLILYCAVIAFLLMYMWTRTRFLDIIRLSENSDSTA